MYRNALDFPEEDQKARFIVKNPVQKGFVALQLIFRVSQAVMPSWGAGEARLRSAHTRRSLLQLLRGKSPCLWAESASRRLRGACFDMCNEASGLAAVASWCLLQHHSHDVSAQLRALTERGSLSPCLPSRNIDCPLLLFPWISIGP